MIREELNNSNVFEAAILQNVLQNASFNDVGFTFVELFAGIGGITYGLESVGGKCLMAAEYDPTLTKFQYAQEAHKLLHKDTVVVGDVTKLDTKEVPDCDVLSFTPPCQSFSMAGKRLGFEDTRGTLVFDALRIAKEKKPKVLLMENVKGLLNHDKGKTFDTILNAMNEIGYLVDFNVINTKFFNLPQSRERTFIIAIREDLVREEKWEVTGTNVYAKTKKRLIEQGVHTYNFKWPNQDTVNTYLKDILEEDVEEKYFISEEYTKSLIDELKKNGEPIISNHVKMIGHADIPGHDYNKRIYSIHGVSRTLNTASDIGRSMKVAVPFNNTYRIRKLTPLECFRVQGFSDDAYYILKNAGFSDARIYKFSGNAVSVNVIAALGASIKPYISETEIENATYLN